MLLLRRIAFSTSTSISLLSLISSKLSSAQSSIVLLFLPGKLGMESRRFRHFFFAQFSIDRGKKRYVLEWNQTLTRELVRRLVRHSDKTLAPTTLGPQMVGYLRTPNGCRIMAVVRPAFPKRLRFARQLCSAFLSSSDDQLLILLAVRRRKHLAHAPPLFRYLG